MQAPVLAFSRVVAFAALSALVGACAAGGLAAGVLSSVAVDDLMVPEYLELYRSSFVGCMAGTGATVGLVSASLILALPTRRRTQSFIGAGAIGGLFCAVPCFSWLFVLSAMPAITDVSSCLAFRPWWRASNGVIVLFAAGFGGLCGVLTAWTLASAVPWIRARW